MPVRQEAVAAGVARPRPSSTTDALLLEAAGLAQRARDVLNGEALARAATMQRLHQVTKVGELATLLGYCISWLFARKAVEAGELSAEAARDTAWRLAGMAPAPTDATALGPSAQQLLELERRVRGLHCRLARLDRLLDRPG